MIPTPEQLRAWKKAAEKATPGPWETAVADATTIDAAVDRYRERLEKSIPSGGSFPIQLVWLPEHPETIGSHPRPEHAVVLCDLGNGPRREFNASFIAIARTAVPALIAAVEELQESLRLAQDALAEAEAENERLQLAYDLSVSRYAELHDGDSIL